MSVELLHARQQQFYLWYQLISSTLLMPAAAAEFSTENQTHFFSLLLQFSSYTSAVAKFFFFMLEIQYNLQMPPIYTYASSYHTNMVLILVPDDTDREKKLVDRDEVLES